MERITRKPSKRDIKRPEPTPRPFDKILEKVDPKTPEGETALHNAAYKAGLHEDDEIVHKAKERGKEYHEVVKPAFEAGKANLPDKS